MNASEPACPRLKPGERLDDLEREGFRIIQDPARFCFGMDAVLLAAFSRAYAGERVMDLGTGTGIVPILMASRHPGAVYTGVELQEASADMAARSVSMNGLQEKIRILQGDLREPESFAARASFDAVTVNPPYKEPSSGNTSLAEPLRIARHEETCTLRDVLAAAAFLLRSRGRFYMIHRPTRLAEILSGMREFRLEPKKMCLVYPKADREPNMVLLEGLKDGASGMRLVRPLVVYEPDGRYTPAMNHIYEDDDVQDQFALL